MQNALPSHRKRRDPQLLRKPSNKKPSEGCVSGAALRLRSAIREILFSRR
jgi:hypothetical protein